MPQQIFTADEIRRMRSGDIHGGSTLDRFRRPDGTVPGVNEVLADSGFSGNVEDYLSALDAGELDVGLDTLGETRDGGLPGLLDFTEPLDFQEPLGLQVGQFAPGGPSEVSVSPEIRELVSREFGAAREFGTENLRREAREIAGRRGLELRDTPVADPFLRAVALLESQLGGQEAGQVLGLGTDLRNFLQSQAEARESGVQSRFQLRETGLQGRQGLFQSNQQFFNRLRFSSEQFQETLRQQAFSNRLQLATLAGNLGLGLARVRAGTGGSTVTLDPGLQSQVQAAGLGLKALTEGLSGLKGLNLGG